MLEVGISALYHRTYSLFLDISAGSDSSESYPGCYGDTSSSWEEEADEEERTGPPPTREELIRRIRDRPFNTTAV